MIAIGCDHGGYELKKEIEAYLDSRGLEYRDYGCDSTDSVDYPIYLESAQHYVLIVSVHRQPENTTMPMYWHWVEEL